MRPLELLAVYVAIGLVVAIAYTLALRRQEHRASWTLLFAGLGTVAFWPLVLPFLLGPAERSERPRPAPSPPAEGPLVGALSGIREKLDRALSEVDDREALGLAPVLTRVPELLRALDAQARSVEEMAALLRTEETEGRLPTGLDGELAHELARTREESGRRLRALHDRRRGEVLRALVRLEELVSMVQLARFARDPTAGPDALVQPIAAIVEALSEITADPEA
jgi:hypothetical protein